MSIFIKMKLRLILAALILLVIGNVAAQVKSAGTESNTLIQFSGVVLDQDSLTPIPFVSVVIKGTKRATISDYYGFFSLVATPGDVLEFHSLVHKPRSYKIADTLKLKYYYAIQVLTKDTIQLAEIEVFPWPSKDD